MSRVATPQQTQPSNAVKVPHEKIAQRAYEKWCKRGCVHGYDRQDWIDAENELRTEMMKGSSSPQHRR
jgi:hypothetical protein